MFAQKKVIIFDMDGTLIDSVGLWNRIDKELIERIAHISVDESLLQHQRDALLRSFSHAKDAYLEYCHFLKETYNAQESKEEIRQLRYDIAQHYMREVMDFKPYAEHFLAYLKQKGFTLVIASTTSRANLHTYQTLNHTMRSKVNFEETFSLILGREVVQKIKPHPEIYHFIMETLHVNAEQCLVIEDSLIGLEAASHAGIETIIMYDAYSDTDRHELELRASASFKTYQDVLHYTQKELV
jgi:beta-phosphoglucomutase-like phosphatase (HAD superfamily)